MIFVGFLADLKKRKFLLRFSELYHQFYLGRCGSEEGLVLKIGAPVAFKTWWDQVKLGVIISYIGIGSLTVHTVGMYLP